MLFRLSVAVVALAAALPALADEQAPDASSEVRADHERFLAIEGGRNFRDAGGYRTADGRTVRWDTLYRSGSLGNLTSDGMARISQLGVGAIIDLRTTDERSRDMTNFLSAADLGYWTRDYGFSRAALADISSSLADLTGEGAREMMTQVYRDLPKAQAPSYRELFARLSDDAQEPVVVNCTAGKDRTGLAVALVLTALGVPYETVREDFLLSNNAPGMETLQTDPTSPLAGLSPEAAKALLGVDGAYLDAAFAQIRQDYGSVDAYLESELRLDSERLAALRRNMLQ